MQYSKFLGVYVFLITFTNSVKADCENRCDSSGCYYHCEDPPVGWIIGGVILGLLLFIGLPILVCFCCAWACFRGRGKKSGEVHVVYAAPPPGQVAAQGYPGVQQQGQPAPGWTVYNGQGQGQGQGQPGYYAQPQPPQHYSATYSGKQTTNQ